MSLIRLKKLNSQVLILFGLLFFFSTSLFAEEESVDIWNNKKTEKKENIEQNEIEEKKSEIDYLKKNKEADSIKITEDANNSESQIRLIGLYDPEKNDLGLNMWSMTDGEKIKTTFKRLEKDGQENWWSRYNARSPYKRKIYESLVNRYYDLRP